MSLQSRWQQNITLKHKQLQVFNLPDSCIRIGVYQNRMSLIKIASFLRNLDIGTGSLMMLMLASQFAKQHFVNGSRPSASTLRRWIDDGVLPGCRIGNNYYVDMQRYSAANDQLVQKVLENVSQTS